MVAWLNARRLPVLFLATLIVGLGLVAAGLITISVTVGLIGTGALTAAAGHWVTYLTAVQGGKP